jgi:phospholipid/cholesterol/gamma-HCH transport system substrate-binding protein
VNRRDHLRRTGAIGLTVTLALTAFTFALGGLRIFERSYTIEAVFASASGIEAGDPVRVAGVLVGSVAAVERQVQDGTVLLRMHIDDGIEITDDAQASIRLRTLLGKKFVDLADPGTGEVLAAGGRIPVEQTTTSTDVDTLLNAADPVVEQTDIGAINQVLGSFDTILEGRGGELSTLVNDLDSLSGTLASRSGEIEQLIDAAARLGTALDGRRAELAGTVDGVSVVLDVLARRQSDLTALLTGVNDLSATLTPLLDRNQADLDAVLDDVVSTVGMLDGQRDRIDLALTQLPVLAERFYEVSREGSWINVYIVGIVATPFVSQPVDLGTSESGEPGVTGGVPRLDLDPTQLLQLVPEEMEIFGATIDRTDGRTVEPPEGFGE